jgi:tRNA uridine 5-carboxymethylaminomethyl modification enzyme
MKYDVIVAGGGHAGIEAAVAAARMNCMVGLVTMDKNAIGRMSCNPAIGGSAKGHLVHEIDALGGVMGLIADATGIQFRILNKSKGPAIWAGRCQSDRKLYSQEAARIVISTKNLEVIEDSVIEAIEENKRIKGVRLASGKEVNCDKLIVTSGTFLNAIMHTGFEVSNGGRYGEKASHGLTESLVKMGFKLGRLKTGTPPRINGETINYSVMQEQPGDENPEPFSLRTSLNDFPQLPQISCFLTYTNEKVHQILEKGFDSSPLFLGRIKGAGPRYCPSIEDKIVRFADKPKHQLFIEPEGLDTTLKYLNGFSSSLPAEIQEEAIKYVPGLEEAKMERPGYAVEYDFFPPFQVDLTLETKLIKGLYFAGQVNGTSGYEEAAGQGLVAGINAALKIQNRIEFTLRRNQAYIGVLIDDLVGKSTEEPYRMFTSRAEYRLLLRQDNADRRLLRYGYEFGLIQKPLYEELIEREKIIEQGKQTIKNYRVKPSIINPLLQKNNSSPLENSETIDKLTKRPDISLSEILNFLPTNSDPVVDSLFENKKALIQVETESKYEGYIIRQYEMVDKMEKLENIKIPLNLNYNNFNSISAEGREKLSKIKPRSLGQASRISGVSPSDISVLLVYLKN